jgi:LacI family transcriptional regulator
MPGVPTRAMPRLSSANPTISTVAARARVAPTTVSRVLNGGYVSTDVRSRVEKVIRDLGYVPSSTARSLKYGRKGCIGVVVESVHGPWFMGLLGGIEEALAKKRLSVLLGGLKLAGKYDASTVASWLDERRVDGLIFARYTKRERPLFEAARDAGIPISFICPDEAVGRGFTVRCRNVEAGRAVAAHLLELGHRRIAFAGGPKGSIDSVDRLRGLEEQLNVVNADALEPEDVSFYGAYDADAGVRVARDFLRRAPAQRPTAVVLGNDTMALAFMRELLLAGLSIPGDVSVVGFDGVEEGARFWPSLTTGAQPMHTLGATACRVLLERIEEPDNNIVTTVEYPMELVIRESTGRAPSRGKAPAPAKRAKVRKRVGVA